MQLRHHLIFSILILVPVAAGCRREVTTSTDSAVLFRDVSSSGKSFAVVEIDLRVAELKLFYRDASGARFGRFSTLRDHLSKSNQQLRFATNAGIFNSDFTPTGLHVESGVEIEPLNLHDGVGNFYLKPNGVFLIDDRGARLIDATDYAAPASAVHLATQSGPILVSDGKINRLFSAMSNSRRIRSGVGILSAQRVVFVLSREAVTFYEVAALFRDVLQCSQALYLDGEISAFYSSTDRANEDKHEYAGMFAVVEKR